MLANANRIPMALEIDLACGPRLVKEAPYSLLDASREELLRDSADPKQLRYNDELFVIGTPKAP
jgi:hypothetical protein